MRGTRHGCRCATDAAVPGAAMAAFVNSGQICSAGTRLFVERKVHGEFTARVAAYGKSLRVTLFALSPTGQAILARHDFAAVAAGSD